MIMIIIVLDLRSENCSFLFRQLLHADIIQQYVCSLVFVMC